MDRNHPLFQWPSVTIGLFEPSAAHRKATGATLSVEAFYDKPTPASERYRLCDYTGPRLFAYDLCAYLKTQWSRIHNHNLKNAIVREQEYTSSITLSEGAIQVDNINTNFSQMFDGLRKIPQAPRLSAFLNYDEFVTRLKRVSYDDPYTYNVFLVPDDLGVAYNIHFLGGYQIGTLEFTGEVIEPQLIEQEIDEMRGKVFDYFFDGEPHKINLDSLSNLVIHVRGGEAILDRMRFSAAPDLPIESWRSRAA